jgi:hypothetical protein
MSTLPSGHNPVHNAPLPKKLGDGCSPGGVLPLGGVTGQSAIDVGDAGIAGVMVESDRVGIRSAHPATINATKHKSIHREKGFIVSLSTYARSIRDCFLH